MQVVHCCSTWPTTCVFLEDLPFRLCLRTVRAYCAVERGLSDARLDSELNHGGCMGLDQELA